MCEIFLWSSNIIWTRTSDRFAALRSLPLTELYLTGKTCWLKLPPIGQWWMSEYLKSHLKGKVPVRIWGLILLSQSLLADNLPETTRMTIYNTLPKFISLSYIGSWFRSHPSWTFKSSFFRGRLCDWPEICTGGSAKVWTTLPRKKPKSSNYWWKEVSWTTLLSLHMEAR